MTHTKPCRYGASNLKYENRANNECNMSSDNNKISKVLNDSRCIFKFITERKKEKKRRKKRSTNARASLNKFHLLKFHHFDEMRRQNQVLFSSSETHTFHVYILTTKRIDCIGK